MLRAARISIGFFYALPFLILAAASSFESRPSYVGLDVDGKFRECDVGSCQGPFSWYKSIHHRGFTIEPQERGVGLERALPLTVEIIESLPFDARILVDGDYLHAELSSPVVGFVNDLEVRLDRDRGLLSARAASRSRFDHGFSMHNFHARWISAAARLRKARAN